MTPARVEAASDTLLDLIGAVQGLLELDEFRACLLAALAHALPSDWVSLNDIGPDPGSAVVLVAPAFPAKQHELFGRLAHENPLVERYRRTRDGRAYRFSDVVTADELRGLSLYREFYAPLGVEYQMACALPHEPGRVLGVALSRCERDYTDSERDLLNRARPFLIQSYRAAVEHSRLVALLGEADTLPTRDSRLPAALAARGLTPSEANVFSEVVWGGSSRAIAQVRGISARTVEKHLSNAYRKLGVHSRADAVALARALPTP